MNEENPASDRIPGILRNFPISDIVFDLKGITTDPFVKYLLN
jgi:hypothetical protein